MRKILSTVLAVALLAVPAGQFIVAEANSAVTATEKKQQVKITSVSGTVKEVRNFYGTDNKVDETKKFVMIEDANGAVSNFIVTPETYHITEVALKDIKAGDKVTGFYDATLPEVMTAIPQHNAVAISVNLAEPKNVKVDLFDSNLISSDNQLKLNISENTKIYSKNGEVYTGDLKGKQLAVIYTFTTRSIPAQTTPEKVVVLDDTTTVEVPEIVKNFGSITGKIAKVSNFYSANGKVTKDKKILLVQYNDGSEANFIVSADTCLINVTSVSKFKVGDNFTGYYDNTKPMIMIYPPQYNAVAASANLKKGNVKVDKFDSKLVSSDGDLKIKVGKNTKVVKQNGKSYTGSLKNKNLVVLYNTSTDSIPAQTTPTKIIILNTLK